MSERKVLNKYYPPDFDPSKIPKLKLPKDRQYVVRLMAPFNMRCKTCGEYIYKGKKFNARKETVQNELYLGLPIFRFYIKCTRCLAEITFKTDPENTDYAMEHGATRNFQAEKLLEEEEKRVQKEREEEELNNPMKVLENRTKDSKLEMEVLENLQELKELNQRQAHVDFEAMLQQHRGSEQEKRRREQDEDRREMEAMMEQARRRRLIDDSDSEEEEEEAAAGSGSGGGTAAQPPAARANPTAILEEAPKFKKQKLESWERSVGALSGKSALAGLVVAKRSEAPKKAGGIGIGIGIGGGSGASSSSSGGGGGGVSGSGSNRQAAAAAAAAAAMPSSMPSSSTGPSTQQGLKEADSSPRILSTSSLSLLGAYSDSEESS